MKLKNNLSPQSIGLALDWVRRFKLREAHWMCTHKKGQNRVTDKNCGLANIDGYCPHGVYVGGCGIDWMCGICESGGSIYTHALNIAYENEREVERKAIRENYDRVLKNFYECQDADELRRLHKELRWRTSCMNK